MNTEKLVASIAAMVLVAVVFAAVCTPASAATEAEIEQAITDGLVWLVAQQNTTTGLNCGSWNAYNGELEAGTGLALYKLCERAYELGYASPFDPNYEYHQNVSDGFNWTFAHLTVVDISPQDHTTGATGTVDDPDTNGNGFGVCARHNTWCETYSTGILVTAISASGTPNRVVDVSGSAVDGWAYGQVAQDMVDYLAFGQVESPVPNIQWEGGWDYRAVDDGMGVGAYHGDQSNSGYAVLGLAEAEDFGCIIPNWVKTELNVHIDLVQDDVNGDANDGGSWYSYPNDPIGVNILKTGNLISEMAFVGDDLTTQRVVNATDYLARHWNDNCGSNTPAGWNGTPAAQYQTMFTAMKGLEYMEIDTFNGIDWFEDFSDAIVAQQDKTPGPTNGSWQTSCGRGEPVIITEWALLTLERIAPTRALIINKTDDVADGDCVDPGDTITYTICYENPNTKTVHNVTIVDHLPANATFVSASDPGPGAYDPVNHTVRWVIGYLDPGEIGCVTLNVTVNPNTGGITLMNCAKINGDEVHQVGVCEYTDVCYQPLNITKTDDVLDCVGRGMMTYTICYDNSANMADVHNVVITDTLPENVSFYWASDPGPGAYDSVNHTVAWAIGTVPGGAVSCVTLKVIAGGVEGSTLENCAEIDSDETDPADVCIGTLVCGPYPTPTDYEPVPVLTPAGMLALAGLLGIVGMSRIAKRRS